MAKRKSNKGVEFTGYTEECDVNYERPREYVKRWDKEFLLDNVVRRLEKDLEGLKSGRNVFHCPGCGRDFNGGMNDYREMGLCFTCFYKKDRRETDEKLKNLVNATITKVEVGYSSTHPHKSVIEKIHVKTKSGKKYVLDNPPRRHRL